MIPFMQAGLMNMPFGGQQQQQQPAVDPLEERAREILKLEQQRKNQQWMSQHPGLEHAQDPGVQIMPLDNLMGMAMQNANQPQARGQAYSNPLMNSLMGM